MSFLTAHAIMLYSHTFEVVLMREAPYCRRFDAAFRGTLFRYAASFRLYSAALLILDVHSIHSMCYDVAKFCDRKLIVV